MSDLVKPCPFCGYDLEDLAEGWAKHPEDVDCYLDGWEFDQFDIAAWNERLGETSRIEALEAELEQVRTALETASKTVIGLTDKLAAIETCQRYEPHPDTFTMEPMGAGELGEMVYLQEADVLTIIRGEGWWNENGKVVFADDRAKLAAVEKAREQIEGEAESIRGAGSGEYSDRKSGLERAAIILTKALEGE